jgi:hypothetical protein
VDRRWVLDRPGSRGAPQRHRSLLRRLSRAPARRREGEPPARIESSR